MGVGPPAPAGCIHGTASEDGVPIVSKTVPPTVVRCRRSILVCALLSLAACAAEPDPAAVAAQVTTLADSVFAAMLDADPTLATQLGMADADHSRLPDNSAETRERIRHRWDALRTSVHAIDPTPLEGRAEWLLYDVVREQLDAENVLRICRPELWGVASYVNGWQAQFTDLALIQPVGTDTLRAQALARAHAIAPWLDREILNLRQGLAEGYSSPKVIVRNVIGQVDDLLATPVHASPFYDPAQRDTSEAFGDALAKVISRDISPAMRRYRDFLVEEYLGSARDALGVRENPDGAACYAATIRTFATVALPADSVFAMGLAEMERVQGEMREISAESFGGEALETLLPRLQTDPRYTFRTSREIIDTSSAILARAKAEMGRWFGRLPQADMIIQPYPEFRQRAGAPGQYQSAPEDGSRPAIFLINPSNPTRAPRAGVENIALHEGIPGHHLQIAIALERTGVHPLIRYAANSGFVEGWALYAERLGDEMGLYSSNLARMGMLGSEAFRAARMVIDAGIHTRGWTRAQALDYLTTNTFVTGRMAEGEIDRYISWPGQAPSYMIGRTEFLRLRAHARDALGDAFDIRAFHDRVLENGSLPLATLPLVVERWIASQQNAAPGSTTAPGTFQP